MTGWPLRSTKLTLGVAAPKRQLIGIGVELGGEEHHGAQYENDPHDRAGCDFQDLGDLHSASTQKSISSGSPPGKTVTTSTMDAPPPDLRKTRGSTPTTGIQSPASRGVRKGKTLGVAFAGDGIVIVRTKSGAVFALEDRCAHRQVPAPQRRRLWRGAAVLLPRLDIQLDGTLRQRPPTSTLANGCRMACAAIPVARRTG